MKRAFAVFLFGVFVTLVITHAIESLTTEELVVGVYPTLGAVSLYPLECKSSHAETSICMHIPPVHKMLDVIPNDSDKKSYVQLSRILCASEQWKDADACDKDKMFRSWGDKVRDNAVIPRFDGDIYHAPKLVQ